MTTDDDFDKVVEDFQEPITVILTQRPDHWLPEIESAGTDSGDEVILALVKGLFMALDGAVNGPWTYDDDDDDGDGPDWVDTI